MDDKKIEYLIDKISEYIEKKDTNLVSPAQGVGGDSMSPSALIITPDMNIDKLSEQNLLYVHAMLHRFYANKSNKILQEKDIEQLHKRVSQKITHYKFDKLDEVDKDE